MKMNEETFAVEPPWKVGLRAARANLLPGIFLWLIGLTVVASYYLVPPVREALERLSDFRAATGYLYASISTAVFGGLFPFLYLRLNPITRPWHPRRDLLFFMGFWGIKGIEVDAFYRLQAFMFGPQVDFATIAVKMLVDQFIYCPLWAIPTTVICFAWKNLRYDAQATYQRLRHRFVYKHVLPAQISSWAVWVPTVCLIYALPVPLQIPLFNLVLCFWTLLYTHIAASHRKYPGAAEVRS